MSETLPQGWMLPTLSEVADWGSGGTPSRSHPEYYGGDIPWIKTGELGQGLIADTEEKITELGLRNSSAKIFPRNSVAIAMYGATIGKTSILGIDAATNQACAVGIPKEGIISTEYLYRYLSSQKDAFIGAGKGGAQPNISQGVIKEWPIQLAPYNEQKRIADKLDQLLAAVDSCKTRLDTIPSIIKRFRQSVLAAATSGELTADWREEKQPLQASPYQGRLQGLPPDKGGLRGVCFGWDKVKFSEIGELGRGKSKHRPRNDSRLYGGSHPFIQTGDVAQSGGCITAHSQTYSEFGLSQSKLWPTGTVCITIAANIADTAILTYPACFPDSVVGFVANPDRCLPQFIKWSIEMVRAELEAFAPATAQKNINLAVLNTVEFALPPLPEQAEIVRRVEALFSVADRLETRYQTARAQVDQLTPSLLAKAFRGELVPQDPNDEPAEKLLERILAAKSSTAAKPKRGRQKGTRT